MGKCLNESANKRISNTNSRAIIPLLHWAIAVLIIFQGILGAANLRILWLREHLATAIIVHEEVGLLILLLTLTLLFSRIYLGRRSGEGTALLHRRLARLVHTAFYVLIFLECCVGILMMGLLGKGITILFWHWNIPITPDPKLVFQDILQIHAAIALILAGLIVIHSIAALYHHYILRDDVLVRMLTIKLM
jgi:cytochrome b561